jgi:hypothetical protein
MNDYQLNLEKSLEIAAKRAKSLNYDYTGVGIVAEADVATYELLKTAAVHFYQLYSDKDGKADITKIGVNRASLIHTFEPTFVVNF